MRPAPHHSGYLGIINFQAVAPCTQRLHTESTGDYPECRWPEDRQERGRERAVIGGGGVASEGAPPPVKPLPSPEEAQ
ncbi:hypothetical protein OYC64_003278 [Pagothenia borchgrevinki]|uniref:Uncharacterized protein n=1 Tax=Pagothenia borchgrevinki TaxID=8213 RepID=A0ABD2FNT1_PAGBO